jgi:hypothetical protein
MSTMAIIVVKATILQDIIVVEEIYPQVRTQLTSLLIY